MYDLETGLLGWCEVQSKSRTGTIDCHDGVLDRTSKSQKLTSGRRLVQDKPSSKVL